MFMTLVYATEINYKENTQIFNLMRVWQSYGDVTHIKIYKYWSAYDIWNISKDHFCQNTEILSSSLLYQVS